MPVFRRSSTLILAAAAVAVLLSPRPVQAEVVAYTGGRWFDGAAFTPKELYSVDGVFADTAPGAVDRTVDLTGTFVVPPFADAHTHHFSDGQDAATQIQDYLRQGVLYAKNPNNTKTWTAPLRDLVNTPETVDVIYANGGLTSSGGHPAQIYDAAGEQAAKQSGHAVNMDGEGYFAIDTAEGLAERWPAILAGEPAFIKVYLEDGAHHDARKNDSAFYGKRGLDPRLVSEVVKRAHENQLTVAAHVNTAFDFRTALKAGVDEINHLPLERLTGDDARDVAAAGVTVVTTTISHRPSAHVPDLDEIHKHNLSLLHEAGVTLAIGTDDGSRTVRDEYENLQRLDVFDRATLLDMWTRVTANAIFPERKLGRLESGFEASFLTLDANPLEDASAHQAISLRVKRGHFLEVAPAAPEKKSIIDALRPPLMTGNVEKAIATYHRLKHDEPDTYTFKESELNNLGYGLVRHGQLAMARSILELNCEEYPHSPNVFDSLAEICEMMGDAECADLNSRRVLELLSKSHYPDDVAEKLAVTARARLLGESGGQ